MILQALYEYYERKAADPESGIAPEGWEWKEIPFLAVINNEGDFVQFQDTRQGEGKKLRAQKFLVPTLGEKKGSGIKSNTLWENLEYMFGVGAKEGQSISRIQEQHQAFKQKIDELRGDSLAFKAIKSFVAKNHFDAIKKDPIWDTVFERNQNLLIYFESVGPVSDLQEIREAVNVNRKGSGVYGYCLVSGESGELVRLEPPIRGVKGANPMGASLVAVNNEILNGKNVGPTPAFASFMKQQGFNSPISSSASFGYTTALNVLLGRDSPNKVGIGDATVVFWAQKKETSFDFESKFVWFFNSDKDNPDRNVQAVKSLYEATRTGRMPLDEDNRFYVLGLAPNAARISVRFWKTGTIRGFAEKIKQHFVDFEIIHGAKEPEHLSLYQILSATVFEHKMDNVPPNLAGSVVVSILDGTPYPQTLLQQCIRRIRAEQQVTRARAAILKACINRFNRLHDKTEKEVLMSLDRSNTNAAYRLGRLFAVLEKIQEEASPGINATIRDRFYGAASATPITVFPQLLKLKNHHLAKLNPGRKMNFEKKIGEIFDALKDDLPAHLTLDEQARFAVGYYHERQDFFTKKDNGKQ
ncbi:MAG: type I-C CRISPR-associated protein Cas8c/Csd1 [Candidatus Omnitrophica bacterium]|nr:type I-C CRISPR-associated protein Cas8c/Csd1 [Candidatus Omnitrophota bacterium]